MATLLLEIEGMSCASCSGTIERAISSLRPSYFQSALSVTPSSGGAVRSSLDDRDSGLSVSSCIVSLGTNTALVTVNFTDDLEPLNWSIASDVLGKLVVNAIESVGFGATIMSVKVKEVCVVREKRLRAVVSVDHMTCSSCVGCVEKAIHALPGIVEATVSLGTNTALVVFVSEPTAAVAQPITAQAIVDAIEAVGFEASLLEVTDDSFVDEGTASGDDVVEKAEPKRLILMIRASESDGQDKSKAKAVISPEIMARFAESLQSCNGVTAVTITDGESSGTDDTVEQTVIVMVDEEKVGPRKLVRIGAEHGLSVTVAAHGGFMMANRLLRQQEKERSRFLLIFLQSLVLTLPILTLTMILPAASPESAEQLMDSEVAPGFSVYALILLLLATPVQFWVGRVFHSKALKTVKTRSMGMDFLISTGTTAAYIFSLTAIIRGLITKEMRNSEVEYFETSSVLITVVLLGKYLEVYARGRTTMAIHRLTALKPKTARLISGADDEPEAEPSSSSAAAAPATGASARLIDAALLQKGDVIRLVAGETVPADGILQSEFVSVDESMMTGESRPVEKGAGQSVYGGTIVVEGSGPMLVTACGDNSVLGKIVSTVQNAQTSKPPIQEFADTVASYFVPLVTILSLITFLVWQIACAADVVPLTWYKEKGETSTLFAFLFALAVWVSACPCAFGLATPTAVLVGTGVAAKLGVLIRRGAAIQFSSTVCSFI